MDVYAGFPREDRELVDLLLKNGYYAKLILGGSIVRIGTPEKVARKHVFKIPDILLAKNQPDDLEFYILCQDGKKDGHCWFFFGSSGERVFPFIFSEAGSRYFVPNGVNEIVFFPDGTFIITSMLISRVEKIVILEMKTIWSGFVGEAFPASLSDYEPMIKTALNRYGIRDVLFSRPVIEIPENEKSGRGNII